MSTKIMDRIIHANRTSFLKEYKIDYDYSLDSYKIGTSPYKIYTTLGTSSEEIEKIKQYERASYFQNGYIPIVYNKENKVKTDTYKEINQTLYSIKKYRITKEIWKNIDKIYNIEYFDDVSIDIAKEVIPLGITKIYDHFIVDRLNYPTLIEKKFIYLKDRGTLQGILSIIHREEPEKIYSEKVKHQKKIMEEDIINDMDSYSTDTIFYKKEHIYGKIWCGLLGFENVEAKPLINKQGVLYKYKGFKK